jgi:hypothetical protein
MLTNDIILKDRQLRLTHARMLIYIIMHAPATQVLALDWTDIFTDLDGDAFAVLEGGLSGLASNGVLAVGSAALAIVKFTPAFGSTSAKFSIKAMDARGAESPVTQVSLTFGELLLAVCSALARLPCYCQPVHHPQVISCFVTDLPALLAMLALGIVHGGYSVSRSQQQHGCCLQASTQQPLKTLMQPLHPMHMHAHRLLLARFPAGGALLAKPDINSITAAVAPGEGEKSAAAATSPSTTAAACTGTVKASKPAALQVTAGTAEVFVNPNGKVKKFGALLGVWVDILAASARPPLRLSRHAASRCPAPSSPA